MWVAISKSLSRLSAYSLDCPNSKIGERFKLKIFLYCKSVRWSLEQDSSADYGAYDFREALYCTRLLSKLISAFLFFESQILFSLLVTGLCSRICRLKDRLCRGYLHCFWVHTARLWPKTLPAFYERVSPKGISSKENFQGQRATSDAHQQKTLKVQKLCHLNIGTHW